ncbi:MULTISPECIES: hypothetical protein [Gordonia]|nr:hypothetical protein [Gordonia terrae]
MSGPRRRAEVARRMSEVLRRHTVRAIPSGWVVATLTGSAVVCRTYDELVGAVAERSGLGIASVREQGLPAHAV